MVGKFVPDLLHSREVSLGANRNLKLVVLSHVKVPIDFAVKSVALFRLRDLEVGIVLTELLEVEDCLERTKIVVLPLAEVVWFPVQAQSNGHTTAHRVDNLVADRFQLIERSSPLQQSLDNKRRKFHNHHLVLEVGRSFALLVPNKYVLSRRSGLITGDLQIIQPFGLPLIDWYV